MKRRIQAPQVKHDKQMLRFTQRGKIGFSAVRRFARFQQKPAGGEKSVIIADSLGG
ncbi:MAG: hypothetical protein ACRD22_01480 [Terriglobia bacterium]